MAEDTFASMLPWLGKCFDILRLDPLSLTTSHQLGKNAISFVGGRGTDTGAGHTAPTGVIAENVDDTHVLVTEEFISNSYDFRSKVRTKLQVEGDFDGLFEFSASASSEEAEHETSSREQVVKYGMILREYQRLILDLKNNAADLRLHLDENFKRAVANLPGDSVMATQDTNPYLEFFAEYGTHFASTLTYGGLAYQHVRVNSEELSSERLKASEFDTSAKLALESFKAGAQVSQANEDAKRQDQKMKIERSDIAFSGGKGGLELFSGWIAEADAEPVPIMKGSVFSRLTKLLTPTFFPDDAKIDTKRQLLDDAIDDYLATRGGEKGRYLHYQEPFHWYHAQFQYNYYAQGSYLHAHNPAEHDPAPQATLVFEPGAESHEDSTIVNTGDKYPVRLRVLEGNSYIEMLPGNRRDISGNTYANMNPQPDLARSTWNIGIYTSGEMHTNSRPLTSGDRIFIYRWDEPTQQYYVLWYDGTHPPAPLTFIALGRSKPMSLHDASLFTVRLL